MKIHQSGFTLIELLVTLAIIATLGTLGIACVQSAREKSRMVVEVNAARNLINGYVGYSADHNGRLLTGYQTDPSVTNLEGKPLHFPMNARYPWRLAPYVPKIEGVMLFNGTEAALKDQENGDYMVSASPNLGLNATLIGGHFGSASPLNPTSRIIEAYGKFYVSSLSEVEDPSNLIVFSSARGSIGNPGYFEIRPPNLTSRVWTKTKFEDAPSAASYGFVDLRWGGKAVTAMLGGNVELLDENQLRDMRRWSTQAARASDPDFVISRQ